MTLPKDPDKIEAYREKLRQSTTLLWQDPIYRQEREDYWKDEEHLEAARLACAKRGPISEENKAIIGEIGRRPKSQETRDKISAAKTGTVVSQETRDKLSFLRKNRPQPKQVKAMRDWYDNLSDKDKAAHLTKIWRNSGKRPNNSEIKLQSILDDICPDSYHYVGDGSFVVGGKCPDFVFDKRIIELFGDYWHEDEESEMRISYFKEYGYRTLIVWESELSDIDLTNRILEFTNL